MPSVTYNFLPGQLVYVIRNGTVLPGTVVRVEIDVTPDSPIETVTQYWIRLSTTNVIEAFPPEDVFENCQGLSGYQDVVFTTNIVPTDVALTGTAGTVFAASVLVDGTLTIPIAITLPYGGLTYQEVVDELNTILNPDATASIVNNNIRITSATTGTSSSIVITDG